MNVQATTYRNYLLTSLLVILVFNYVDRLALGVVLQDIKVDLDLTDTQLGFLSGIAFALFYSVMGVPIARWADRGDRVVIIVLCTGLWSVAVLLCGVATSFVQLLLIRVVVAIGEAGCTPPAFSLIADYFNRAERPRAAAIYGLGGPLATIVGFFLAGWLNELYGWRVTFMALGAPGLLLAALAWFTLKEPRRARCAAAGAT
jgi:MFS family permease